MSLNLDDIKNYVVVSDTLNVTRASEIIGLSQPALSYSLKRLESEIGAELFVRLKNGVKLTKVGEEFYSRAKRLIQYWEESQNLLVENQSELKGEFSIGIHPSVAIYSLDKILPKVMREFPKINFKLHHGLSREMAHKVINWEIDFALAINPTQHPDIVIKELGKDEVGIFASSKLNQKLPQKLIYDPSLAQSTFILKNLKKAQLELSGYIHSGNLEVIAKLAASGLGYGLLPSRVAAEQKNLKLLTKSPRFQDKICLIYRKEKHQNYASQTIIESFRSTVI